MSDTPVWMPLYVADYLQDTRHLSSLEHGAYLLLLMHTWSHDGGLPSDSERLRRIAGLTPREWKTSWPVIRAFFTDDGDGYRHKRIDRELSRAGDLTEKRRAAANARWGKEKDSKRNASASATKDAKAAICTSQPQPQPQPQPQKESGEGGEVTSLLAFPGRTVRLNARDFADWEKRYSAIPDLRAELGALDDWFRGQEEKTCKNWFHVVSASLAKKHQRALSEAKRADDGELEMPIC